MRIFTSRPMLRWLAPLAFLLVVAGSGLVASRAIAEDKLPTISAEKLLVAVQEAKIDGLSGTVVQNANLGIPSIPGTAGSRGSNFNSLISGSHTLRVWYASPDKARVALLGTLGESDLITNGKDVWLWSSETNEAQHRTIDPAAKDQKQARPDDLPKTPQEAAQRFLSEIGPTTTVSTDSDVTVAGRSAYELVLKPKDDRSLVTSVKIAVDGETFVPLRVQVFGSDATDPAFSVAYESVDFTRPEDRQFTFTPPPGAKVTEAKAPTQKEIDAAKKKATERRDTAEKNSTVVGKGWTSVVVMKAEADTTKKSGEQGDLQSALEQLPKKSGAWGSGRVLEGTIFSAVITDDGRVAIGAVEPQLLFDALQR